MYITERIKSYKQKLLEIEKIVNDKQVDQNTDKITTFMADFTAFIETTNIKETVAVEKLKISYRSNYFKEMPYIVSISKGLIDNLENFYQN
jgi:hypothetical protein